MWFRTEINEFGNRFYYDKMGRIHREDGPAVEFSGGSKEWWIDGRMHREDGPAYEGADGACAWKQNGLYHRLDGPAIIYSNGHKEWWIEGVRITEEEFNMRVGGEEE